MSINSAVIKFKTLIEDAIQEGGTIAKNNLIRSSIPINLIHEAVKDELINAGIPKSQIFPPLQTTKPELELWGFLKKKKQDVTVTPSSPLIRKNREKVGLTKIDPYGKSYTERTLSINVRSQLSSAAKNFDTLYERTFAEAFNLHGRCPNMVLGEVYMIAIREYDSDAANHNVVSFKPADPKIAHHVEKYIQYFELLNNRTNIDSDLHKYEKIALVLVDFSQNPPKVYNSDNDLLEDGYLPSESNASIANLTFESVVPNLLRQYVLRFGSNP